MYSLHFHRHLKCSRSQNEQRMCSDQQEREQLPVRNKYTIRGPRDRASIPDFSDVFWNIAQFSSSWIAALDLLIAAL